MIFIVGILCFIAGFGVASASIRNALDNAKSDVEELTDENEELRCELVKAHNELRRVK